jgi:hypothetical protein
MVSCWRLEGLSRTLLLFGQLLEPSVTPRSLATVLGRFKVGLLVSGSVACDPATQSGLVVLVQLLVRSGMRVGLSFDAAPSGTPLLPARREPLEDVVGRQALSWFPGAAVSSGTRDADLLIILGDAQPMGGAPAIWLSATGARAAASTEQPGTWEPGSPLVALAAAGLAASEAHKAVLRTLPARSKTAAQILAPSHASAFDVGIDPLTIELGAVDVISGGAITNWLIVSLLSLADARVSLRVFDDDRVVSSNLNRCGLFRTTDIGGSKVGTLQRYERPGVGILPVPRRFTAGDMGSVELADAVVVGADDVGARHDVQRARPAWLGVGATEDLLVLASEHSRGLPCAGCLHPNASHSADGPVPTASIVSFWAGFVLALRLMRHRLGVPTDRSRQVTRCFPLRMESLASEPASLLGNCPVGHDQA